MVDKKFSRKGEAKARGDGNSHCEKRSKVPEGDARELIGISCERETLHSFDKIGPGRSQMVVRRSCLIAKPSSRADKETRFVELWFILLIRLFVP